MGETNNIFLSWSGERSKRAAEALRELLPIVLQAARPWMSDTDIEKGSRGLDEVGRALESMKVGIICLTPDNLTSEWIRYEAGALSKIPDAKTRVCTYLVADLEPQDVKPPLGMFQATRANRDDTLKLVLTINKHLEASAVSEERIKVLFDKMWPDLGVKLQDLPEPSGIAPQRRSVEEMVAEILEINRAMASEIQEIALETAIERQEREWKEAVRNSFTSGTLVLGGGPTSPSGVGAVNVASAIGGLVSGQPESRSSPTQTQSSGQPTRKTHAPSRSRQDKR